MAEAVITGAVTAGEVTIRYPVKQQGGHGWGGYDPILCKSKTTISPVRNKKMFAFHYYNVKFEMSLCSLSHCKLSGQTVIGLHV